MPRSIAQHRLSGAALLLLGLSACQPAAVESGPKLQELRTLAEARHEQRQRAAEPLRMTISTRSALEGVPEQHGTILRQGDEVLVESWADTWLSSNGIVSLGQGDQGHAWYLFGQRLQRTEGAVTALDLELTHWFDSVALDEAGTRISGEERVAERDCWIITLSADEGDATHAPPETPPMVRSVRGMDGQAGVRPLGQGAVSQLLSPMEDWQRLWVDKDTLQLVQLEGLGRGPAGEGLVPNTLTWSAFREVEPGLVLPHRLELRSEGSLLSTSEVRELEPRAAVGAEAFDPIAINDRLEIRAQDNNEEEYRRLISQAHIKQPKGTERPKEGPPPLPLDDIVSDIGLRPGEVVADIGAGTGINTPFLARAVGPTGRVLATDVNPALIDYLHAKKAEPDYDPDDIIEPTLNAWGDIGLPEGSLDVAFICNVGLSLYTNLAEANQSIARSIYSAVKPGGRLVVVESRFNGPRVDALATGWSNLQLRDASDTHPDGGDPVMEATELHEVMTHNYTSFGFELERELDRVPGHAYLLFRKPEP